LGFPRVVLHMGPRSTAAEVVARVNVLFGYDETGYGCQPWG
jgi:hypothetical protein